MALGRDIDYRLPFCSGESVLTIVRHYPGECQKQRRMISLSSCGGKGSVNGVRIISEFTPEFPYYIVLSLNGKR